MNRKPLYWGAVSGLFLLLSAAVVVFLLLKHEPGFYERASLAATKERHKLSVQFASSFAQFYQDVTSSREWRALFPQDAINSFFQEQFVPDGWSDRVLPEGITEPRVAIEHDRLCLAFRYNLGFMTTVISIDMCVWLAPKDPNAVVLELKSLHAGALPIAAQSLLEQVSETARQNNIDVTWYRHEGNPVALLHFQADQDRPTFRLEHLALDNQRIEIFGRSTERSTFRAMVSGTDSKTH